MICAANSSFAQPLCQNWGYDCSQPESLLHSGVTDFEMSAKINLKHTLQVLFNVLNC